jgi:hypothetical protein
MSELHNSEVAGECSARGCEVVVPQLRLGRRRLVNKVWRTRGEEEVRPGDNPVFQR